MRFLSSLVVTVAVMSAAPGLPSAWAEQPPVQKARPEAPSRVDLGEALKSLRQALCRLDRCGPRDAPEVIRPDPELDRAMEKRPPHIGSAMPAIVPRE